MPKISELPLVASPTTDDTVALVDSGTTSRATLASLPISTATQAALDLKAPIASPTFTGTTTIPTVAIAGGTITGITDLTVADGGTGASTAAGARTNLGATATGDALFTATTAATARTTLGFTSALIDRAYATYTANANLSTILPTDDTIPQNTEGVEIISLAFTPKATTSRLRLTFNGQATADAVIPISAAIFSSASANALASSYASPSAVNDSRRLTIIHEYVPGSVAAITFSVRAGPGGAANMRFNGTSSSRVQGGTIAAVLTIEEFTA